MNERNNIISIVTPSYNQGQFIAETIESVIFQKGDFYIDYIIMDGGSQDNTVNTIMFYEDYLKKNCTQENVNNKVYYKSTNDYNAHPSKDSLWLKNPMSVSCKGVSYTWVSEKDDGQYDAIRKGFEKASGSVFAYINSDDMYIPNAFAVVSDIFLQNPFVHWLKGLNGYYTEKGCFSASHTYYSNLILKRGYYDGATRLPFLQQESTFWSRDLYERVKGMPTHFDYAGDYALWRAFSKHERLFQIPFCLAGFRFQKNQKTVNMTPYYQEISAIGKKRYPSLRLLFSVYHRLLNSELARPVKKLLMRKRITYTCLGVVSGFDIP